MLSQPGSMQYFRQNCCCIYLVTVWRQSRHNSSHYQCLYFRIGGRPLWILLPSPLCCCSFLRPLAIACATEYDIYNMSTRNSLSVGLQLHDARLLRMSADDVTDDYWQVRGRGRERGKCGHTPSRRRRSVCSRHVSVVTGGGGSGFTGGQLVISPSIPHVNWLTDPLTTNGRGSTCGQSSNGAKSCARCRWSLGASAVN